MTSRRKLAGSAAVLIAAAIIAGAGWYWLQLRRDAAVTAWLRANAMPLTTVDPMDDLSDLRELGRAIGDAQIVGAGEATHGTREHSLFKHRLLRFLVTQKGFRAIAFESPWPTSLALNHYVLSGEGDPEQLLRGAIFGVWHTQEVLDMVRWMREHNASVSAEERVEFVGIDTQLTRYAARTVAEYLARVDPEFRREYARTFDLLVKKEMEEIYLDFADNEARPKMTTETRMVSAATPAVLARLDRHRDRYVAATSEQEFDLVRQHARVLVQQADVCEDANSADRDRYMADNLDWYIARRPGVKVMVWAHNGHVGTRRSGTAMGRHLRDRYGQSYVSLGFVLGSGAYRALDARSVSGPRARFAAFAFDTRPGTLNAVMKATGQNVFAVDFRDATDSSPSLFDRPFRLREGYGIVTKRGADPLVTIKRRFPDTHDILIFIEPTAPARSLDSARRQ